MKALLDTYESPSTTPELITKMPLTKGGPYKMYILRAICVEDIKAGDRFFADGGFSVTDDATFPNGKWTNYPIMACCFIRVSDTMPAQGFTLDVFRSPENIDTLSGQNINKEIHHYRTRMSGTWLADCDYPRKWFLFCGYAASAKCTLGANEVLTVDQEYGQARVDHYRDIECLEGVSL